MNYINDYNNFKNTKKIVKRLKNIKRPLSGIGIPLLN
jgi:hypothetical protein